MENCENSSQNVHNEWKLSAFHSKKSLNGKGENLLFLYSHCCQAQNSCSWMRTKLYWEFSERLWEKTFSSPSWWTLDKVFDTFDGEGEQNLRSSTKNDFQCHKFKSFTLPPSIPCMFNACWRWKPFLSHKPLSFFDGGCAICEQWTMWSLLRARKVH